MNFKRDSNQFLSMTKISSEIECFRYDFLYPFLREILIYKGCTPNRNFLILGIMSQHALINFYNLTKWYSEISIDSNIFFFKPLASRSEYENLESHYFFESKNVCKADKKEFEQKKPKINLYCLAKQSFFDDFGIESTKTLRNFLRFILFVSFNFDNFDSDSYRYKKQKKIYSSKLYCLFSETTYPFFFIKYLILFKKWRAEDFYLNMSYIAFHANIFNISSLLIKMAFIEKQTVYFLS